MHKRHFHFLRKLRIALVMCLGALFAGIAGFMLIEGYDFTEAFYTTIIIL